jgi:preprotein translocase subunit SecA
MVTKSIERAQKKIEAMNFGGRKNIIEYDDVMNYQRDIVYNRRNYALHELDISKELNQIIEEYAQDVADNYCSGNHNEWDMNSLYSEVLNTLGMDFNVEDSVRKKEDLINKMIAASQTIIEFKKENFDSELFNNFQKFIILRTIDEKWQDHLYTMDQLREGIGLRAYGQKNPLIEYKQEGFAMFEEMMVETNKETLKRIFRTDLASIGQRNMNVEQKTKNLQAKKDVNVLSAMSNPQAASNNSPESKPSFLNRPNQPMAPNQKRQPIKVDKKIGRNEPCPCGSGKKYKKCCA